MTLALALATSGAATAGPLQPSGFKAALGDARSAAIVDVNRCHRRCRYAYSRRWGRRIRHRHVGPACRPVFCGRAFRNRPRYWRRWGCFRVGRYWYCN